MTRSSPTLEPRVAPWLPAWVLGIGLLLWPRPALASGFDGPQWVGAGIALGLFLLVLLAATWILRKPSPTDMESGTGLVPPVMSPAASLPAPPDFADSRLGRLQQGIARRRLALEGGKRGFAGDTEVMARFLEACDRMERGEAPPVLPGRQLPPGTLTRLTRLYEQLKSANPARARDWPLQRASLSSQIRTTLGQRDTNRFLELLDLLAERRVDRKQPTQAEAEDWSDFLGLFRDTPANRAPLASSPDAELAVAEDVPTSDLVTRAGEEDAPTVDADHLFPSRASLQGEEDAPTVDTDLLFPGPAQSAEAQAVDAGDLPPVRTCAEEDAPTVDAASLFPASLPPEDHAQTRDSLVPDDDAPTVNTENLFPTRKISIIEDDEYREEAEPTIDTFRLFDEVSSGKNAEGDVAPSTAHLQRGAGPTRPDFTETDVILDSVEDAPTRDTADLFRKE